MGLPPTVTPNQNGVEETANSIKSGGKIGVGDGKTKKKPAENGWTNVNFRNDDDEKSTWTPGDPDPDPHPDPPSFREKFANFTKNITLEPVMFIHSIAMVMMYVIAQSLKIYKICRVTYNQDVDVCTNLTAYPDLEKEIQRVASDYGMYWSLIQTGPGILFAVFLGPWSDKHGRKLVIILPIAGMALACVVFVLAGKFDELPPQFILLGPAVMGLSGGVLTFLMATFSYISDVSDPANRTVRIAWLYGVWYLGAPIGSTLSGALFPIIKYEGVFSIAAAIGLVCVLYVIFFVKDVIPKGNDTENEKSEQKGFWKDLFDTQNIRDGLTTSFKERPNNGRTHIWILIFCLCGIFLPVVGEGNIRYLYTRLQFHWDESMYSYYLTCSMTMGAFGVMVVLPLLTQKFKLSDLTLAIVAIIARTIAEATVAFSFRMSWMMFVASIPVIGECVGVPLRSLLTKCVEPNEVGKVFTMLTVVEAGLPIISGIMYSQVYNATLHIFPGAAFLMTVFVYILVFVATCLLAHDMIKHGVGQKKDDLPEKISKAEEWVKTQEDINSKAKEVEIHLEIELTHL